MENRGNDSRMFYIHTQKRCWRLKCIIITVLFFRKLNSFLRFLSIQYITVSNFHSIEIHLSFNFVFLSICQNGIVCCDAFVMKKAFTCIINTYVCMSSCVINCSWMNWTCFCIKYEIVNIRILHMTEMLHFLNFACRFNSSILNDLNWRCFDAL